MFQEYYPISDQEDKRFIIMQDDKDGSLAILKSVAPKIIERLKGIDQKCYTIPIIHEFGEDYIIEENIDGTKLADIIEIEYLEFSDFVKIIRDVCLSLAELHKNQLCHMDISPENIIESGGCYILYDYSASKVFGDTVGVVCYGTKEFCSPEHFGFDTVSAETDIYSLGKLIGYLMRFVRGINHEIMVEFIRQCTTIEKSKRISSIEVFLERFNVVCRQHTDFFSNDATIKRNHKPVIGGFTLTEDMLNSLSSIFDLAEFIEKNEKSFIKVDVVDYFNKIFITKKLKKSDVIHKSGIERTYGYQILNGTKKPSRDKVIQLCIGASFSLEETQIALKKTGFAPLYPKNRRDCIIIYGINTCKSIVDIDELLNRFKENLLNEL